jgi:hypothetical protein
MTWRERWDRWWYAEIPAIRLDTFRQVIVLSLIVYMLHRFMYASEWLSAVGFHPSPAADKINAPQVPLLPPGLVPVFGVGLFASLVLVLLGWLRRPATWVALVLVEYATLADPIAAFTLNRVFVFALLILALAPNARPPAAGEPGPMQRAWPVRLLQLHLLLHYFASGACKSLHGLWLVESDLLWRQLQEIYMTDVAAYLVRSLPPWAFTAQQALALGFELLAPVLLGVRRLRPIGIVLGLGMHIFIAVNMHLLIYFSLQMMCFYVLFIEPDRLTRWSRALR